MEMEGVVSLVAAAVLAPLLPGLIQRTKSVAAGRRGPPLLQTYYDLAKLLRKGAVYSRTTTWLFRVAPSIGLASLVIAATLLPFGPWPAWIHFPGDLLLFAGLLALARFATVLAALDTGSSFEGMGASREMTFAALGEPALVLALAAVACRTSRLELTDAFDRLAGLGWGEGGPALALVVAALFVVLLAENSRIPVDDPATHLELTMIHEVMVLDHGGPDLAYVQYGSALKLWLTGVLLVDVMAGAWRMPGWPGLLVTVGLLGAVAVGVGVVESVMARLRLRLVPQLLVGASAMAVVSLVLVLR